MTFSQPAGAAGMSPDVFLHADQAGIADGFVAGFYLHRRRGCVDLPVRVWFGPPLDLDAGDDMDRSWRWQVEVAGVVLDDERGEPAMAVLADVWPRCRALPVPSGEAAYLQARIQHARSFEPTDPFAHRYGRVDLLTAPVPF